MDEDTESADSIDRKAYTAECSAQEMDFHRPSSRVPLRDVSNSSTCISSLIADGYLVSVRQLHCNPPTAGLASADKLPFLAVERPSNPTAWFSAQSPTLCQSRGEARVKWMIAYVNDAWAPEVKVLCLYSLVFPLLTNISLSFSHHAALNAQAAS